MATFDRPGGDALLEKLADALAATHEDCPALTEVLRVTQKAFAASPAPPAPLPSEAVVTRSTAHHGLETVTLKAVAAGGAIFGERALIDWSEVEGDAVAAATALLSSCDWQLGSEDRVARQICAFCTADPAARARANAGAGANFKTTPRPTRTTRPV